jgi:hypothetical protein
VAAGSSAHRASWDGAAQSRRDEDFAAAFVAKVGLVGLTELALDGATANRTGCTGPDFVCRRQARHAAH